MDTNSDSDIDVNENFDSNIDNEEEFIQYGGRSQNYDRKFKTTVASVYVLEANGQDPKPNFKDTYVNPQDDVIIEENEKKILEILLEEANKLKTNYNERIPDQLDLKKLDELEKENNYHDKTNELIKNFKTLYIERLNRVYSEVYNIFPIINNKHRVHSTPLPLEPHQSKSIETIIDTLKKLIEEIKAEQEKNTRELKKFVLYVNGDNFKKFFSVPNVGGSKKNKLTMDGGGGDDEAASTSKTTEGALCWHLK